MDYCEGMRLEFIGAGYSLPHLSVYVPAGSAGTVAYVDSDVVSVRLDDPIENLVDSEWDNCIDFGISEMPGIVEEFTREIWPGLEENVPLVIAGGFVNGERVTMSGSIHRQGNVDITLVEDMTLDRIHGEPWSVTDRSTYVPIRWDREHWTSDQRHQGDGFLPYGIQSLCPRKG